MFHQRSMEDQERYRGYGNVFGVSKYSGISADLNEYKQKLLENVEHSSNEVTSIQEKNTKKNNKSIAVNVNVVRKENEPINPNCKKRKPPCVILEDTQRLKTKRKKKTKKNLDIFDDIF